MDKPSVLVWNKNKHIQQLLSWQGIQSEIFSSLIKVQGFDDYNSLIDINSMFSRAPEWHPVDRTGSVSYPWLQHISRPWQKPSQQWSLDQAMSTRVANLESLDQPINLFWSGGIDSTAALTAFLKYLKNKSQLRVLYSPWATYEHPEYLKFLDQFQEVDKIDISGEVYMNKQFDGIFISGNSGDEIHASLDESFFNNYGYNTLEKSWQDFFWQRNPSDKFIEFCEKYFGASGRPIDTVLEARWWFYTSCKITGILNDQLSSFFGYDDFNINRLVGFYDCQEYENYIYWNITDIMIGQQYHNWKQNLKNWCCEFDGFVQWRDNKSKYNSGQLQLYQNKKIALTNQHWIAILNDGTRISTPSLPILTKKEFCNRYGNTLDYLFNESNKI